MNSFRKYIVRLIFIVFLVGAFFQVSAFAHVAFRIFNNNFSKSFVDSYIENYMLGADIKMELFAAAQNNVLEYEKLKKQWVAKNYSEGLKLLAYVTALEHKMELEAILDSGEKFEVSQREIQQQVHDLEVVALSKYKKERGNYFDNINKHGKFLIENSYPHKKGQSSTSVYQDWLNTKKRLIEVRLRLENIYKYLMHLALADGTIEISGFELATFFKEEKKKIRSLIIDKRLTLTEAKDVISRNPSFSILIKKIEGLDPINSSVQSMPKKIRTELTLFLDQIFSSDSFVSQLFFLEQKAKDISEKNPDSSALDKSAQKSFDYFIKRGQTDSKVYTLSKLYRLASFIIEENPDRKMVRRLLQKELPEILAYVVESFNDEDQLNRDEYKDLNISDYIRRVVTKELKEVFPFENFKKDSFIGELVKLVSWSASLEGTRFGDEYRVPAEIELYTISDYKLFPVIKRHLEKKEVMRRLKALHFTLFKAYFQDVITLTTDSNPNLTGDIAFEFIVNNAFCREIGLLAP